MEKPDLGFWLVDAYHQGNCVAMATGKTAPHLPSIWSAALTSTLARHFRQVGCGLRKRLGKAGIAAAVANQRGSVAKDAQEGRDFFEACKRALRRRECLPSSPLRGARRARGRGPGIERWGGHARFRFCPIESQLRRPMGVVVRPLCMARPANRRRRWAGAGGGGGAAGAEQALPQEGRWRTRRSCPSAGRSA